MRAEVANDMLQAGYHGQSGGAITCLLASGTHTRMYEVSIGMKPGNDDEFTGIPGAPFWRRLWNGFLVSLTGTIGVGVGDINLAEWLARLRFTESELVLMGWPRLFAGLQSLLSTLVLAIWALALFGEPFD